jgi:ferrous iron transport protein B
LDAAFTHPILGLLAFVATMGGLFWTLFALATVPMDLIEATFAGLGDLARSWIPDGPVRDLLTEGIIGGVAGTVVFLPQICLLFFLISLLEDTGYLARAAFVMDRVLHRFGLPGHAFVPLLTSHACAIPGIMSTRLIPNRRDRLATILVAPFMSCSARLPVF